MTPREVVLARCWAVLLGEERDLLEATLSHPEGRAELDQLVERWNRDVLKCKPAFRDADRSRWTEVRR